MNNNLSSDQIKQTAYQAGFDLVGITECTPLESEIEFLDKWLDQGKHASMSWLSRNVDRRADPRLILKDCKSVIAVGVNYQQRQTFSNESSSIEDKQQVGKIASYAVNKDYHHVMGKQMKKFCLDMKTLIGDDIQFRWYVDTGPVMEKVWAQKAGLGFIGKNTCLINRQKGSWFFLGVIFTDMEIQPDTPVMDNWCGDCTKCIDACPTGALDDIGTLDSNKCISYLTIEHRAEVNDDLKPQFEGWLFGCDICQEVCPYNIKFAKPSPTPKFEQINPDTFSLNDILNIENEEEFRAMFKSKNPLRRAKLEGLQRTARILKANSE